MKKQDLKVGMSFDVVYVLKSNYGYNAFNINRTTIMLDDFAIPNSNFDREHRKLNIFNHHDGCLFMSEVSEIKKIAKLTITKLK